MFSRGTRTGLLLALVLGLFISFQPAVAVTLDWSEQTPDTGLINPQRLAVSSEGRLAVWDQTLQRWLLTDSSGRFDRSLTPRVTHQAVKKGERLGVLSDSQPPRGYWDQTGNFWSYFPGELGADPSSLVSHTDPKRRLSFDTSVQSLVPLGDRWIIQDQQGNLTVKDPYLDNTTLEKLEIQEKANLVAVNQAGEAFFQSGRQLVKYRDEEQVAKAQQAASVELVTSDTEVFIFTEDRLGRLNDGLGADLSVLLPGVTEIRDVEFQEDRLWVLTDKGVHVGEKPTGDGGIFGSTERVNLRTVQPVLTRDGDSSEEEVQFWVRQHEGGIEGRVKADTEHWFAGAADNPSGTEARTPPLGLLQSTARDTTFWHPDDRYYHYFDEEGLVEEFGPGGDLRRSIELTPREDAQEIFGLGTVDFLGANEDVILFTTMAVLPNKGPRRIVMIYDQTGELNRAIHLREPIPEDGIAPVEQADLVFDGEQGIYRLGSDHVRRFDLYGYPTGTELGLTDPQNLRLVGDHLYVVESGPRLVVREPSTTSGFRYGTLPSDPEVRSVTGGQNNPLIVISTSRGSRLARYHADDRSFETMVEFDRPIRAPAEFSSGDAIYFWSRTEKGWRLGKVESPRFNPREQDIMVSAETKPRYVPGLSGYLIPPEKPSPDGAWRLVRPDKDTVQHINMDVPVSWLGTDGEDWLMAQPAVNGNSYRVQEAETETSGDTQVRLRPGEEVFTIDEPLRGIERLQGGQYRVRTVPEPGYTRIQENSPDEVANDSGTILRGDVKFVQNSADHDLLYRRLGPAGGHLVEWHEDDPQGGVQGRAQASGPTDLEGLPVWIQPGGHLVELDSGGQFTVSNLPVGRAKIWRRSHQHFISEGDELIVQEGEYSLFEDLKIDYQENSLLETALNRIRAEQYQTALFALRRFSEARMDGPAHGWSERLSRVVRWRQGSRSFFRDVLEEDPGFLPPAQRWDVARVALLSGSPGESVARSLIRGMLDDYNLGLTYRLRKNGSLANQPDWTQVHRKNRPTFPPLTSGPSWWSEGTQ